MKYITLFTLAAICTTVYSCTNSKNTSTGNPLVNLNMTSSSNSAVALNKKNTFWWLAQQAIAFAPPASINDSNNNLVILFDFWINISELEFKMSESIESGEQDGSNIEFEGPYLINLFSSNPTQIASGEMTQNVVRRIKYKTKKVSGVSGGNPSGMNNSSLYLTGTVAGNNFTLAIDEELAFVTAGPNLVTFNSGDNLLLQVETAEIIRKINLSTVSNNEVISSSNKISAVTPCPTIDASSADLYTCFIKAFQQKTKIGKDNNGDDSFDSEDEMIN